MKQVYLLLITASLSLYSLAQIPNAGFETWNGSVPQGWSSSITSPAGLVQQSSQAHGGSSAVRLNIKRQIVVNLGGAITTPNFTVSGSPSALKGWYILSTTNSNVTISATANASLNGTTASIASQSLAQPTSVYTQFSIPFTSFSGSASPADAVNISFLLNALTSTAADTVAYALIDDLSLDYALVSTDEKESASLLEDAYPNPANGVASIIYSLNKSAAVNLSLFDMTGRKVEDLISLSQQASGRYKAIIDTERLISGVYFYTLTVDGINTTKKLIVNH